jgi:hypothetical protein
MLSNNVDNPLSKLTNQIKHIHSQVTEDLQYDTEVPRIEPYVNDPDILKMIKNTNINYPSTGCKIILILLWISIIIFIIIINR